MSDLTEALDLLDLAVAISDGLSSEASRQVAAETAAAVRRRQDFFSESIVVAVAGGTGSGKSSLLNAIAGQDIAETSELRPHTNEPLAWVPAGDRAIAAMITSLGIEDVVVHEGGPPLTMVDLPDLDSVDSRHRTLVESVLPVVDAVVWMFDPVKYHDPSIHDDFLADVVEYEPVFTFVMNKIDRLDEAETEAVVTHLGVILAMDGFDDPDVLPIAANPPGRSPIGIDALVATLNDTLIAKRADRVKVVKDVLQAGRRLAADTNVWVGTSDDAYDRIRGSLDDRDELGDVLGDLGIEGPLRSRIIASSDDGSRVDQELLRRAELAAVVAALGVVCTDLAQSATKGML
jgi:GTP-binding protein EngB required for normal cell division